MSPLCKYSNIFGEPNTGAHSVRFLGVALIDVALTVLVGAFISYYWGYNIYYVLAALFLTGIIAHRLFCVRTTIDKLLFR